MNAKALLEVLKRKSRIFETDAVKEMFHKPEYPGQDAAPEVIRAYWQWECDAYGCKYQRPVNRKTESFEPAVIPNYSRQMWSAYFELKAAGLVLAINNGTNEYWIQLKKKM